MFEILKRALDEALTAAYAGEIPAEAEDAAFSEGFEREMRGLIRKTDRPIQKVIPILTAAACAVIAIGCAVLLPRLLSHSIPVEPNEDSAWTDTSAAPTDEPIENTSAAETSSDEPTAIQNGNPGAIGAENEEDTTERDDEKSEENGEPAASDSPSETEPSPQNAGETPTAGITDGEETADEPEEDEEENITADDPDEEKSFEESPEETETDSEDDDTTGNTETGGAGSEIPDDDVNNAAPVDPDDDIASDDSDDDDIAIDDSDDDDAASVDGSLDEGDDMDLGDDEPPRPSIAARATLNGEVKTLLGCSLAESYLHSGGVYWNGSSYSLPIMEGIDLAVYRDPALAERIGAAKYIGDRLTVSYGNTLFYGTIGKEAPVLKPPYESDRSDRNCYDELYFHSDRPIEDVMDDEDESDVMTLDITDNGIVLVGMRGYGNSAYYQLDSETLEALTARIEARYGGNVPQTVGELSEPLGTAEDYARVYVSVSRYYDCTMCGAHSDGTFFAELLEKYKEAELRDTEDAWLDMAGIRVELTSKKARRTEIFNFYADGTVTLSCGKTFTVDPSELRVILTEYCRQKNLAAPVFYETLGEYLTGKNFTTLSYVRLSAANAGGDRYLDGDDAEIRALIEEYAAESTFLPDGRIRYGERESIDLHLKGWLPTMQIGRDTIQIGNTNFFRTPDGLYDRLSALLSQKGRSPYAGQGVDDDDVTDDDIVEDVEE